MKYRNYRELDLEPLAAILAKNWNYKPYGLNNELCRARARQDLLYCLSQSNYTEVAEEEGKLVGVLLGRIEKSPLPDKSIDLERKSRHILLDCLFDKKGRLIYDYAKLYDKIDGALLDERKKSYGAEIVLLMVDPEDKKKGIGKNLMEHFIAYLKEHDVQDVFVFTDSTCDVGFYDRMDFDRKGHKQASAPLRKGEIIDFYIYEKDI